MKRSTTTVTISRRELENMSHKINDLQAENEWLYGKLRALIEETNPITWHHAGLRPSEVKRVEVKVRGERE